MADRQSSDIMVSAVLITYNQEKYVRQAIESILCQQTDFRYEILVGDDCSADETAAILREYADKYPDMIRLDVRGKNVGANRNSYELQKKASGKYIAMLEGDDYWLGTDRLQTLVDYMNEHPEYIGVSHRRERRDTSGHLLGYDPADDVVGKVFTVKDFLAGKRYSQTGSLFKNFYMGSGDKYEAVCRASRNVGDFFITMITLDLGNVYVMDKVFGVYRVRIGAGETNYNSTMSQLDNYFDHITMIRHVEAFFGGKYRFTKERLDRHCDAILYCIKRRKWKELKKVRAVIRFHEKLSLLFVLPVTMLKRILKMVTHRKNNNG